MEELQPHIRCSKKDAAKYALLPGDPERIDRIKKYLDNPVDIAYNREFRSCSGFYKGVKVMAISTGIGGASTAIAVEELRKIGVEAFVRIGSCGALQDNIRLGDLVIASGVVRNDGASDTYIDRAYPAVPNETLFFNLAKSSDELGIKHHLGLVRSHDSFYTDNEEEIDRHWSKMGVLGADMESAALLVIARLRGLKAATVLNTVVENEASLEEGVNDYVDGENLTAEGEKNEIIIALEALIKLENQ